MIDTKHIKLLLDQVNLINITYEKLAKVTGENFNIFKILLDQATTCYNGVLQCSTQTMSCNKVILRELIFDCHQTQ